MEQEPLSWLTCSVSWLCSWESLTHAVCTLRRKWPRPRPRWWRLEFHWNSKTWYRRSYQQVMIACTSNTNWTNFCTIWHLVCRQVLLRICSRFFVASLSSLEGRLKPIRCCNANFNLWERWASHYKNCPKILWLVRAPRLLTYISFPRVSAEWHVQISQGEKMMSASSKKEASLAKFHTCSNAEGLQQLGARITARFCTCRAWKATSLSTCSLC